MKKINEIYVYPLIIMGILLILVSSCKKIEEKDVKTTPTTVIDSEGNIYHIVSIGTQVWMKENLKVTKYRNGDLIGTTTPAGLDIRSTSTPKYQWAYNGNESNVDTYGRLYTWFAVTDIRNICPAGWHIPTDAEWTTLATYLGGENVAGGKLKEIGTTHWLLFGNTGGADNSSGFTALPGGFRDYRGYFSDVGFSGTWWSSTEFSSEYVWLRDIYATEFFLNRYYGYSKNHGFSVRCLRD